MKIDLFFDKNEKITKFTLLEDVMIFLNDDGHKVGVIVKSGFISDGASIPKIFWNIINPFDARYIKIFLKHDYGYAHGLKTRLEIDKELKQDLIDAGMEKFIADAIYLAVRRFGGKHWKKNSF